MIKIGERIQSVSVIGETQTPPSHLQGRPAVLHGYTYKISPPTCDHAIYVTINNLDEKPFEIFINSKAMEHFQWIVALTRLISAVFRKGGDVTFLVEELGSVFDPKGGYFKKGGKYMPSLVAEIGDILKCHLIAMGLYQEDASLAKAAVAMIEEKSPKLEGKLLCAKCHETAVVVMDGCQTCLSCGDSKCS